MSEQHTVIEVECLEDGCDELQDVTYLGHARTDRQTEIVLDAHVKAARLHEEEAGHEFNVSVETGTPSEMETLYEDLTGERLVADGGTTEEESAGDKQATGTLIRVNHGYSRYTWHHSVSFDGYVHETACGQSIDTGIETVIMDIDEWENLDARECCDECAGSVRSLIEDWDGLHEKYEVYENGDRVENCFVLEPNDDAAARAALIEYAEETDNEELAQDLRDWVVDICTDDEQVATDGGQTPEEQKEAHRIGTINRWDAPDADWPAEYDWTRHRGPPVFPVPGGWTLGFVEADGTSWRYYGDAGVGEDHDNDVDETEPGAYASLGNEPAEDVGHREEPDREWTLKVDGVQVFRRVEPDRDDLYGAVAEALHAYHTDELDDRVDDIVPTSGRKPDDVREQEELEKRREENAGLDEFATDGGVDVERFIEHPAPDRFFMQIGPAEVEMEVHDHDDVTFKSQLVPGGSFGVELSASSTYAGRECKQHLSLDRDAAESLHERLGEVLEADHRE